MPDYSLIKQKQRQVWASGQYQRIAQGIQAVAEHVVRSAQIRRDERVLDIACGTGNTALTAAARGAAVTGLDFTPELLALAQSRVTEVGHPNCKWIEGDAENLPFEDASFDVVVSSCGLMFAPDPQKVASEVARVLRPGGRIAIQAWTLAGGVGRLFELTSRHAPAPPGLPSPFNWGDPTKVKDLFGPTLQNFRFEHHDCPEFADTPEQVADLFIQRYGPTHRAYHSLPPEKAAHLRQDILTLFQAYITPADQKVRWGREYLITLASRP